MTLLALFTARLRRTSSPLTLEIPASASDDFRRVASECGWLFSEEPRSTGWVRISCEPATNGSAS